MNVYANMGQPQEAIAYGEESIKIARSRDLPERLAFTLNDIHTSYLANGQTERSWTT